MIDQRARYVYGIIDTPQQLSFSTPGIGRRKGQVYTIPHQSIAAIVSRTPFVIFDPTDSNLFAHEHVLQEALIDRKMNVVPMRFSTVVGSEGDVHTLLKEAYEPFMKNIAVTKGKVEVGVKVFVDDQVHETFGENVHDKTREIAEQLYATVKSCSVSSLLNELLTTDMILNASFLVERGKEQSIMENITAIDQQHTDILEVKVFGPNAPYNFVNMPVVRSDGTTG
jgi:hypothetical protein